MAEAKQRCMDGSKDKQHVPWTNAVTLGVTEEGSPDTAVVRMNLEDIRLNEGSQSQKDKSLELDSFEVLRAVGLRQTNQNGGCQEWDWGERGVTV